MGVLAFAQGRQNFTHQSFPGTEMVDQHSCIRLYRFRERPQCKIRHTVGENIIHRLIAQLASDARIEWPCHKRTCCINVTYVTLTDRDLLRRCSLPFCGARCKGSQSKGEPLCAKPHYGFSSV